MRQNYVRDLLTMRYGAIDDGSMVFSKGCESVAVTAASRPNAVGRSPPRPRPSTLRPPSLRLDAGA